MTDDFTFEITEHLGKIADGKGGWAMELNLVSWSGREPKYDIRSWSPDHKKMGKGITLSKEEISSLAAVLSGLKL